MEQQHNTNEGSFLDAYTKDRIGSTARSAGIVALLSITSTIVSVIAFLIKPGATVGGAAKEGFDDAPVKVAVGTSVVEIMISLVMSIILFYTLYNFSRLTKKGLETNDNEPLKKGIFNLANYFKFTIIAMAASLIYILVSTIAAGI